MKYIKPVVGKDVDNNESNHFSETYDKRFHTNIPVTFGQVFAPGDVPAGLSVKVNVGGNPLQTQVDDKATHPDGSLRHAVITAWLPALGAGQSLAAELVTSNSATNGSAVSATDLLATSFDAVIELTSGLWSLLFLSLTMVWKKRRELLPLRHYFSRTRAQGCVLMACAMTAMPAQANTPGLVLHWSFDEATVTDNAVGDVSGMGLELNPMSWAPGVVASMIPAVNAWWFGAVDT